MHVDYSLEFDDLFEFNVFTLERSATIRRQRVIARLAIPAVLAGIAFLLLTRGDESSQVIAVGMCVAAGGLFLLYPKILRNSMTRNLRRMLNEGSNDAVLGFRRLTIGPDELTQAASLFATTWKWQAIDQIVESPTAAYFHISAMSAIMLPKRAFENDVDYQAFVRAARQFHSAAIAHTSGAVEVSV